MTAIRTSNLTKRYEGVTVVDNVSLSVKENTVYGLLGPNGAGKSTLLNILLGLVQPSGGEATVHGFDTRTESLSVRERVGALPDRFDVFPRLTGKRHLEYVIDVRGDESEPSSHLERVGLGDAADDVAENYSRGMQQRLALAMALVGEPEVLIFDEPFSGLDPDGARMLRKIISEEADRGATILVSSHLLDHVERVSTHVGVLSEGRLIDEGTPDELRSRLDSPHRYELRVSSNAGAVHDRLRSIANISRIDVSGNELTIAATEPIEAELVFKTVEDDDIRIDSFTPIQPPMEELFNAYVGDNS
ncbi:ABC transporter ATP-binding protein [Haloarchaeobius iranensis]|uniref:ABC-2 type transport system ATP-binding protein n=1 Tax=Haloarchaeobius iranensis TaxID=996166 RepID=A0A1G9Z9P4_9EURY|nr:ABC transporter ATP-binding protein [Haloarchaeobius iranensis]SDN17153.1 ABC-2 type transport system ATP-binding protein [Haloarchaeobius iranensis]